MTVQNKDRLPLHKMEREDAVAIFEAWLGGAVVEYFAGGSFGWSKKSEGCLINLNGIYRIPTTPDEYPWDQIDDRFICGVTTKEGRSFICTSPPESGAGGWVISSVVRDWVRVDNILTGFKRGTTAPEDSLVWRPG